MAIKLLKSSSLLLLLLLILPNTACAQYVSIPDSNFAKWLNKNYPSAMSGNQMDTSTTTITWISEMDVSGQGIASLEGLKYFDNLNKINCDNNLLTELPELPFYLYNISCQNNQLSEIRNLRPHGRLNCSGNKINKLELPSNSFWELRCSNNLLTRLPSLPYNLQTLIADNNLLDTLPPLPQMMTFLNVDFNAIRVLPALNNDMQVLSVRYNQLDTLPFLPDNVRQLICSHNNISSIPNVPRWITKLDCSYNKITELPAKFPEGFFQLYCGHNLLKKLPQLPEVFQMLHCEGNELTDLPKLSDNLYELDCSDNKIACFSLFEAPFLNKINISGNPATCLPNYHRAMDSTTRLLPLCAEDDTTNNPRQCPVGVGIGGHVYRDINGNCRFDDGEGLSMIELRLKDANKNHLATVYSDSRGSYGFVKTKGNYFLEADTSHLSYDAACPGGIERSVTVTPSQLADNIEFGFTCKPNTDFGVQYIAPIGIVFPGRVHTLSVGAGDYSGFKGLTCGAGTSGTVEVTVEGKVKYKGPAVNAMTPVFVQGSQLSYQVDDFAYINGNSFNSLFSVDTNATDKDSICVFVKIILSKSDGDDKNNTMRLCYPVRNSYDPNIKETYPSEVPINYKGGFTYTVHFQNTGTAAAFDIRIADTLDELLEPESFEVLAASHPLKTTLYGRALSFMFKDIMLPDSHSNSEGSKGFVQYRIAPKNNLPAGTKIRNTAYIYFDYNSPVITNTTLNEYKVPDNSISELNRRYLPWVYPNPSTGLLNIFSEKAFELSVTDISGREITVLRDPTELNLPPGLYFFTYSVEGYALTEKVLVY